MSFKVGDKVEVTDKSGHTFEVGYRGIVTLVKTDGLIELDNLVGKGLYDYRVKLTTEPITTFLSKLPTMYKVVKEDGSGKLRSLTGAGTILYYEINKMTVSNGEMGIFVESSIEFARERAKTETGRIHIHECVVIGEQKSKILDGGYRSMTRYPAIVLGAEVPLVIVPEKKWVDVTADCNIKQEKGRIYIYHQLISVLNINGTTFDSLTVNPAYKVTVTPSRFVVEHL